LPSRVSKAQRPDGDKAQPTQRPHARVTSAQVVAMAIVQGGQRDRQVRLLVRSQAFHQQHSNLPALLYLGARGPERPMRGIMEHA
jgi:hypothetical protein